MIKKKTGKRLMSLLTTFAICSVAFPAVTKQADVIAVGSVDDTNIGITIVSSSQVDALVNVALAEEGYNEKSNNDNIYGSYYKNNNKPWCAYFISWCARKAGIPTSVIKDNASAQLFTNSTIGKFGGKFYLKGNVTPQVGDIVYYDWNKNGSSDHVEIVISVNTSNNTFTSLGGNTKGDSSTVEGVHRHSNYSFTRSDVFGFERPNYSNVPPEWIFDINNAPKCSSTRWIGFGSVTSGDDVKWVQYALNEANNAGLTVDGVWGTNSKNATIALQKKYGLKQDGQAGKATINKLVEILTAPTVPTGNEMSKGAGQTIADGDYWIESTLSKRYLVDIGGNNYDTANGTNLKMHIWDSDAFGKYDAFTFKYLNNGFYQITQRTTNMAIDINGASVSRGANVQMYKNNNSTAQQWSITKTSTGYKLQARCSGYCLDVSGGNIENNTNLQVWEDNGTNSQRFNLIPYKCSHTFGSWSTSKAATCTADGKQTRKCTDCGYTESKMISKTGHSLSSWEIISNPTCTKTGTRQRDCSRCGYGEAESIPALGHSLGNWTTSKNATCTADGTQVRKCSKCSYSEEKVIAKTGHKYIDSIIAPTCTEKGYTNHTCSICKNSYNNKETNSKGHTFTSKMINGYMTYICSDCGYIYTAPFEGEGTAENPFIISNADELKAVSETVNNTEINQIFGHAHYRQAADIDLENISWTPIGLGYDGEDGKGAYNCNTRMFFGVYDGNQHTIYNLNVDKNWIASGLFGCVRSNEAEVCNLVVYGNIISDSDSGGITGGLHYEAKITNCAFIGDVNGNLSVGGIAGYINGGASIINCYHNGNVTGGNNIGGIVGEISFNQYADDNASARVENCYHTDGEITIGNCALINNCKYYDGKNNTITINNCYSNYTNFSSAIKYPSGASYYDNTLKLSVSQLKEIAEDLGETYVDNTNPALNNGFPVFPWQLEITLKGDADANGVVDVDDAVMLQDWLLGSSDNLTCWENVDLCEDDRIDVFDLCLLRKFLAENDE